MFDFLDMFSKKFDDKKIVQIFTNIRTRMKLIGLCGWVIFFLFYLFFSFFFFFFFLGGGGGR